MSYIPKRRTQTLGPEALKSYVDFLAKLEPGKKHVYFTGLHASGDWCAAARKAYEAGLGVLVQKRVMLPDGKTSVFEYLFIRSRGQK